MKKVIAISGLVLGMTMAPQAHGMETAFKLLGGMNFTHTTGATSINVGGFDAGGGFEFMFSPAFGLSVEGFFSRIGYDVGAGSAEFDSISAPLLFLLKPSPYFTIGLGGMFRYYTGLPTGSTHETYDIGLGGMLGTAIPLGKMVSWVIQGRAFYGLIDQSNGVNYINIQALTGIRFSFGGGRRR